ncbi:replication initiation protein [Bacillus sp. SH7-1]|uniref:primase C-terminal domain-containing protein n=1 Tax=Bacillus sp. SH7-1 TaxID=2217818 RepID=UPI0011CB6374|nr:primase C-terminal domain-containing protein [Bacillus sp. SH7-1]TXR95384.1 replication initiation protein [Bacillus sp. SH7-1]
MNTVQKAINLILHNGVRKYKHQNSNAALVSIAAQEKFEKKILNGKKNKKGSIFITRKKEDLSAKFGTRGVVLTSEEAVLDHVGQASHWTPNVYNFGTYSENRLRTIVGHTEKNLQQINCFVIDIDSKSFPMTAINDVALNAGFGVPTMILQTTKGYQVYYVLDQAVYVTNKKSYIAIKSAKRISQNLREMFAESLPQVDLTCNHFGFFRMPSEENMIMFFEENLYTFKELQEWSKRQDDNKDKEFFVSPGENNVIETPFAKNIPVEQPKQVEEAWFKQVINCTKIAPKQTKAGRNNAIFTLSLACFQSEVSIRETLDMMDQFNSNLEQPLDHEEVRGIVMSAYSGKYQAAHKDYIDRLLQMYATPGQVNSFRSPAAFWRKHKKQREDRVRSHWHEWEADIIAFLSMNSKNEPVLYFTQKELCEALNIPRSTLNTVLNKSNKIYKTVEGKGKTARTGFSTIGMLISFALREKEQKKENYLSYLNKLFPQVGNILLQAKSNSAMAEETVSYSIIEGLPAG